MTRSTSSYRLGTPAIDRAGRRLAYKFSAWRRPTLTLREPDPTRVVTGPLSRSSCRRGGYRPRGRDLVAPDGFEDPLRERGALARHGRLARLLDLPLEGDPGRV